MLVCRKNSNDNAAAPPQIPERRASGSRKLGEGGPVFFPRRKPSALGRALLAQADQVTAYDKIWFVGRPSV